MVEVLSTDFSFFCRFIICLWVLINVFIVRFLGFLCVFSFHGPDFEVIPLESAGVVVTVLLVALAEMSNVGCACGKASDSFKPS